MDFRNAKRIIKSLSGTRPFNFCCDASERAHRGENRIRKRQTAKWIVFLRS